MESDPRLAGPGTVRAWEETGVVGSISPRLSSVPGLLDLCTAPLLECVHGMSGEGSSSSSVMSAGLKLLGGNFSVAYAGLYAICESPLPCSVYTTGQGQGLQRRGLEFIPTGIMMGLVCFGWLPFHADHTVTVTETQVTKPCDGWNRTDEEKGMKVCISRINHKATVA